MKLEANLQHGDKLAAALEENTGYFGAVDVTPARQVAIKNGSPHVLSPRLSYTVRWLLTRT